MQEEPEEQ
jgi:hypothetical protein